MSQDFNGLMNVLTGQPRMEPGELYRRLEQVIQAAPMPFDDGAEPLFDNELQWIGEASALITVLGDIGLIGETQVAINGLTSGRRQIGFQKLMVILHKARALAGLRFPPETRGAFIPAADRTVSIGHNSPEQKQALEKIDELVEAVKRANDLPGTPEEREQIVAELSAGRKLLEATKIRVAAVQATLQPALRWILEKAGGAVIGKLAGQLWEYLVHLKF
jgi:hypothetical protein